MNKECRDYKKKHECYFCGKMQAKMARHLISKHSDVQDSATIPDVSTKVTNKLDSQRKRKYVLDKYQNLGDFNHNVETLKNKSGILIVGRRPTQDKIHKPNEYLLCQYCYVFFESSELWRHVKTSPFVIQLHNFHWNMKIQNKNKWQQKTWW